MTSKTKLLMSLDKSPLFILSNRRLNKTESIIKSNDPFLEPLSKPFPIECQWYYVPIKCTNVKWLIASNLVLLDN